MKNKLSKVILSTLLVAGTLCASDETISLIGIEGGFGTTDVERSDSTTTTLNSHTPMHGGLKIGAQSNNYRVFLSGRYYTSDEFDYITTFGAELQYLINFSQSTNFFLGANVGLINIRFSPIADANSRTVSDKYFGGDAGVNIHIQENIDLEIGARVMTYNISNTKDDVKYTFDNMITGYASIIFKYQMD